MMNLIEIWHANTVLYDTIKRLPLKDVKFHYSKVAEQFCLESLKKQFAKSI